MKKIKSEKMGIDWKRGEKGRKYMILDIFGEFKKGVRGGRWLSGKRMNYEPKDNFINHNIKKSLRNINFLNQNNSIFDNIGILWNNCQSLK